jgi:hypothetical protein
MEVDSRTDRNVWLKTAAQIKPSALVLCDEFVTHHTANFFGHLWQTASWRCLNITK